MEVKDMAKISSDELSVKLKFYLGVLINAAEYEDRTLLESITMPVNYIEHYISVNSTWRKHILHELMDNRIVHGREEEDGDDYVRFMFDINVENSANHENLYEELVNPEITEQNLNEMISIFTDDIHHLGMEMVKDILNSPVFYDCILMDILNERRDNKYYMANTMREFFARIVRIMEKEITIERDIIIDTAIENVKEKMISIYNELFKVRDDLERAIGYHMGLEYNIYTAMVCKMVGKDYQRRDVRELLSRIPEIDDWNKLD